MTLSFGILVVILGVLGPTLTRDCRVGLRASHSVVPARPATTPQVPFSAASAE